MFKVFKEKKKWIEIGRWQKKIKKQTLLKAVCLSFGIRFFWDMMGMAALLTIKKLSLLTDETFYVIKPNAQLKSVILMEIRIF